MREQADNLTRLVSTFGRQPAEPQKNALPSPGARGPRQKNARAAAEPPARQQAAAGAAPAGASSRARPARAPAAAPRRARGGAQPIPVPDTDWEEF
jgi:hypothetical protein